MRTQRHLQGNLEGSEILSLTKKLEPLVNNCSKPERAIAVVLGLACGLWVMFTIAPILPREGVGGFISGPINLFLGGLIIFCVSNLCLIFLGSLRLIAPSKELEPEDRIVTSLEPDVPKRTKRLKR